MFLKHFDPWRVFMAPSFVLLVSSSERKPEGVSPVHLSPGQLTGWDLIATVRSVGGIYLCRVKAAQKLRLPEKQRHLLRLTISELLLHSSALLDLAVTAVRVQLSRLVLKGRISF